MLKQPNFFHSQPSTLPKDAPAKFYLSTTFGLSFVSSVASTRSSYSYAYLTTKIGNRNLNVNRPLRRENVGDVVVDVDMDVYNDLVSQSFLSPK